MCGRSVEIKVCWTHEQRGDLLTCLQVLLNSGSEQIILLTQN